MMEEARDFIAAHYALTQREDTPFWAAVKYETEIPDSLAAFLAASRLALPDRQSDQIVFKDSSWVCVLVGMNFLPNPVGYASLNPQDVAQQLQFLKKMQAMGKKLGNTAMSHYAYLKSMGCIA